MNYSIELKEILKNIVFPNIRYIIIILLISVFVSLILFILLSYFIIKILKISLNNTNIFFYQYNKKSQKKLDLYGNNKITRMYLIRQPFSKFITLLLNIMTLYNYEKLIKESHENFPYHTSIVFEITLDNGLKKLLLLEKNNCINISDNFVLHNQQNIKDLNIKTHKYSINDILNATQQRLGNEKYFNWNLYKNNCQEFTKEILKTIGKYNKTNKEYIFRDKLFKLIIPSDFTLHIGNCMFIIYNMLEKYIYDSDLFSELY